MTTESEFASYLISLEKRVDRLKTLEEDPPAVAGAWTFITSQELAIASASMIFNNITQIYDDLMIIWRTRSSKIGAPNRDLFAMQFNGDTIVGNYDTFTSICGKDTGYLGLGLPPSVAATGSVNDYSCGIYYLPEYTNTSKKLSGEGTGSVHGYTTIQGWVYMSCGAWSKAGYPALTSIKFYFPSGANLLADSHIELYGLNR